MARLRTALVPVTPFQQNCALIWDDEGKRGAVIDPGGDVDRILEAIGRTGIKPEQILLTHGHIDHAGGAAELRDALNARAGREAGTVCTIAGPDQRDQFLLQGLAKQARSFGLSGVRDVLPDRWLTEGASVSIGGLPFIVLHCPGHTPGHIVFVSEASRFAILGDVLFQGSVGRTDFPYGDHRALIASIRQKLLPLGDDIQFICGHGPGSTIGAERQHNPFLRTG